MGQLVFILGRSGTGKSNSLRNFPKDKVAVCNVLGKMLPFKGGTAIEQTTTDNSGNILKALDIYAHDYKTIVIDDYQYVMSNEFMRRAYEKGYDKFTEIAKHAWDIANKVRDLPDDVIVYIMCHTDRDDEGNEKIKTIGKLLDEKICLEGLSTIVLKTNVTDGVYTFLTQNNGKDTVKSPAGMFPTYAIDNDLWYVDQKIRNYYEMGDYVGDEEIAQMDQAAAKTEIDKESVGGRRNRRKKESAVQETNESKGSGTANGQGTVSKSAHDDGKDAAGTEEAVRMDTGTGAIRGATHVEQKQIEAEEALEEALKDEPVKHKRRRKANAEKKNQTEETSAEEEKEEAAAEQHKKRRRKPRNTEEELDGFMNIPDNISDEEVPFN